MREKNKGGGEGRRRRRRRRREKAANSASEEPWEPTQSTERTRIVEDHKRRFEHGTAQSNKHAGQDGLLAHKKSIRDRQPSCTRDLHRESKQIA